MEKSIVIQLYQFIANYTAYRHLYGHRHRTSFPLTFVTIFSLNQFDLRLTLPNILVEIIEDLLSGGYYGQFKFLLLFS